MNSAADKWTIVLFATAGLDDFIANALGGIVRCGINPNLVQLVIPKNAAVRLVDLGNRFGVTPRILDDIIDCTDLGEMPSAYVDYGTQDFNRLMRARFRVIRALLEEGKQIVSADIDIAWFRNPLDYLSDVLLRYPWACQTEAGADFPPNFCMGFFALRAAPACLKLIDAHIARFSNGDAPPVLTMQAMFNQIVRENPEYLQSIFPLPEALFANGLLHSAIRASEGDALDYLVARLQPFVFHSNFTIGLKNKRRLLRRVGGWSV